MNEIDKPTYLYEGESLEFQNWNEKKEITFDELVKAVRVTSEASQASALKAINRMLTMRNWLIFKNMHQRCLNSFHPPTIS